MEQYQKRVSRTIREVGEAEAAQRPEADV